MDNAPVYSTLRDRAALADLVREFAGVLPDLAAEIARQADRGALDEVRRLAHQLKGSAGGYGYPSIMGAAALIEASAGAGDGAHVTILLRALRALCARARIGAGHWAAPVA